VWNSHHTCIVDQDIDLFAMLLNFVAKLSNRVLAGQIKSKVHNLGFFIFGFDVMKCLLWFLLIPCPKDNSAVVLWKLFNGCLSDTCISAGYNYNLSCQISVGSADATIKIYFRYDEKGNSRCRKGESLRSGDKFFGFLKYALHFPQLNYNSRVICSQ